VSKHSLTSSERRRPHIASPERREQILDRASELATEAGLGQLTMKRIAARVGFSEAAIYRHFPTKQALLLGLMDRLDARLLGPIRAAAGRREVPATARLQEIVQHHLSLVLERHGLPIQLLAEASAAGDPVLLSRMRTIMRAYLNILGDLVDEAAAAGSLPPRTDRWVVAMWLLGGPAAMAIQHRLRVDSTLERRVANKLVPFMFHLLGGLQREKQHGS
jgi:TetR/AcrR family transcriptional regulator